MKKIPRKEDHEFERKMIVKIEETMKKRTQELDLFRKVEEQIKEASIMTLKSNEKGIKNIDKIKKELARLDPHFYDRNNHLLNDIEAKNVKKAAASREKLISVMWSRRKAVVKHLSMLYKKLKMAKPEIGRLIREKEYLLDKQYEKAVECERTRQEFQRALLRGEATLNNINFAEKLLNNWEIKMRELISISDEIRRHEDITYGTLRPIEKNIQKENITFVKKDLEKEVNNETKTIKKEERKIA